VPVGSSGVQVFADKVKAVADGPGFNHFPAAGEKFVHADFFIFGAEVHMDEADGFPFGTAAGSGDTGDTDTDIGTGALF